MLIDQLKVGDIAKVTNIKKIDNKAYLDELCSLGLVEGAIITCIRKSIFNKLLHIRLNNSLVVLRKSEVQNIDVESVNNN